MRYGLSRTVLFMVICLMSLPSCTVSAASLHDKIAATISERTYEYVNIEKVFKPGDNEDREKSPAERFRELQSAAKSGDPEAQMIFGGAYLLASFFSDEGTKAKIHEAAESGHTEAYKISAEYHPYLKSGPKHSRREGLKWLRKAAEQNYADALFTLGLMNYFGLVVKEDKSQAFKYFKRAADSGNPQAQFMIGAMYHLGETVRANDSEALKWWRKAAEQDYPPAQGRMGTAYYFGKGVKRNVSEAFKWWEKSANNNYPAAQCRLGTMYYLGKGTLPDKSEALKWWKLSAEHEDPQGEFCLGAMYYLGEGVEQSYSEAANWWNKSAEQGYDDAKEELEKLRQEVK